jgi:hypothetical protein
VEPQQVVLQAEFADWCLGGQFSDRDRNLTMLRGRAKGARPFSLLLALLAAADEVIEQASRCRLLALFGHAAMSDLSP